MTPDTLANPAPATEGKAGHQPLLDWIRFLAALLVVFCHARVEHWAAWAELDASSRGPLAAALFILVRAGPEAVVVFFVLSGYLVGGKVIQRCREKTFSPSDYVRDRASRILTPLVPAILLTMACVWFIHGGWPDGYAAQLAGNLLQLQGIFCEPLEGNAPLWSLSYEVWFYVLAGSLGSIPLVLRSSRRVVKLVSISTLALFAGWCLSVLSTTYLFCWAMGALAYVLPVRKLSSASLLTGIILAALGTALSQSAASLSEGSVLTQGIIQNGGMLLLSASVAFLLPGLALIRTPACGFIEKVGPMLAAFSYTLYLTHFPLLLVMRGWHTPYTQVSLVSVMVYLTKISLCLVTAWILYLPFERNTARIRRFLRARSSSADGTCVHA